MKDVTCKWYNVTSQHVKSVHHATISFKDVALYVFQFHFDVNGKFECREAELIFDVALCTAAVFLRIISIQRSCVYFQCNRLFTLKNLFNVIKSVLCIKKCIMDVV